MNCTQLPDEFHATFRISTTFQKYYCYHTKVYEMSESDYDYSQSSSGESSASHVVSNEYVYSSTTTSVEHAKAWIESLYRYQFLYNSFSTLHAKSYYECVSHVNCSHRYRLTKTNSSTDILVHECGMHTEECSNTNEYHGIRKDFIPEIDAMLRGGAGPKGCVVSLKLKYKDLRHKYDAIPTPLQVKNRKAYLKRTISGKRCIILKR